jgi:S-(hydroxymethyl)glutathione dehydrogenase/alcohol dehydrogenase
MKAAVLRELGADFVIEDVDIDSPLADEVLVDVKASALCHSDMTVAQNGYGHDLPAVLGHEVAGVISAIGSNVRGLEVGDHVVGCLTGYCGVCEACVRGNIWMCANPGVTARAADQPPRLSIDGKPVTQVAGLSAFAEQLLVHHTNLVKIDNDVPLEKAALLGCGVITGAGAAINTAGVRFGDTVAVIGCGGVGLSAVQGAAVAGAAEIIAIDLDGAKAEQAGRFGATQTICAADTDAVRAVHDLTGGLGVHHAFEMVGSPQTARQALDMLRRGGTAFMAGMQKPGTEVPIDPFGDLVIRQRNIRCVYMGSTNFKYDIPVYAKLYQQGRFNLDDLVSQTLDLADINRGYEDLKAGRVIRSVITF